ncbi:MAG: isoprenylcysteine carboxylmethyltransferase family protein [Bdellovibrionales bacterium]|nr:isoprenylcysteine carboxylmethyltransferase family protein [Bdellovibrionales bacterium]
MILVGFASLGRLWCSVYIAGNKTYNLVETGPFSMTRNPLYFFSFLGGVGVGLSTETVIFPLVIGGLFAVWYPLVIRNEETRLLEVHGDAFVDYMKRVPRFFPNPFLLVEPEQAPVYVKKFRKAMFDALWFIWLVGLLEAGEGFRQSGILPTLFTLL